MDALLSSVSSWSIWGSISSFLVLGAFLIVQASYDKNLRRQYLLLSAFTFGAVGIDLLYGHITPSSYELLRTFWWPLYGASVLCLLNFGRREILFLLELQLLVGVYLWLSGLERFATSTVLPISFFIAACGHGVFFLRRGGFASAVLWGLSLAQGIGCTFFLAIVSNHNSVAITLGYLQYAVVTISGVLFGWVQLPRELRQGSPVKLNLWVGIAFASWCALSQSAVFAYLWLAESISIPFYLTLMVSQLFTILFLHFFHRDELVIYTDDITQLLQEKTASLKDAHDALMRKNAEQREILGIQEKELHERSVVINRQNRVELASKLSGQIAHDLRNLIIPCEPVLEEINQRLSGEGEGTGSELTLVSTLRRRLNNLVSFADQILILSKNSNHESQLIYLSDLFNEVKIYFTGRSIEVECDPLHVVVGSRIGLLRAILNLVTNSFEAQATSVLLRSEFVVIQETKKCHLGFLSRGEYLCVSVEDNGIGVPEALRESLFEPFVSTKIQSGKWTRGLGLSVVATCAKSFSATVDLQGGPGITRFDLYFSNVEDFSRATVRSQQSHEVTPVVIYCDSHEALELVNYLRKKNIDVDVVSSYEALLDAVVSDHPSGVFLGTDLNFESACDIGFKLLHLRPQMPMFLIEVAHLEEDQKIRALHLGIEIVRGDRVSDESFLQSIREQLRTTKRLSRFAA